MRLRASSVVAMVTWIPFEIRRLAKFNVGLMWPCNAIDTMRILMFGFSFATDMVTGCTKEVKYYGVLV